MTAREQSKLTELFNRIRGATRERKLATLLCDVREATRERGKKSELARFLNQPLPRIYDWLREKDGRAPGGEITLLMLEWVTAGKGKQQNKNRDSVVAPSRPKTQKRKHSYAKPKSGR